MTQAVRSYLLGVVSAGMLCALVQTLTPKGAVRRVSTLACALVLILTVLSPLRALDVTALARAVSRFSIAEDAAQSGVEIHSRELIATLIKQKCEAYILDKAQRLGAAVTAEVTVDSAGAYPYPSGVRLTGAATPDARRALGVLIEENLAIPSERQEWVLS